MYKYQIFGEPDFYCGSLSINKCSPYHYTEYTRTLVNAEKEKIAVWSKTQSQRKKHVCH